MVVLRAIGRFFAKIGRWIRDTAWVQPLLIVGGIFALVFSIPYITSWVKSWSDKGPEDEAYYSKFNLAMSETKDDESGKANQLFTYLKDRAAGKANDEQIKQWGDKFFVAFVQEDCAGCEANYTGFEYAQKNWNKNGYDIKDGNKFAFYTIEIDKKDDEDNNVFQKFFFDEYDVIFEESSSSALESNYATNISDTSTYKSELTKMETSDTFASPTVYLIDFTNDAPEYTNKYGISEVMFTYEGSAKGGADKSTSQAKAQTIVDAWNHAGIFSNEYKKD